MIRSSRAFVLILVGLLCGSAGRAAIRPYHQCPWPQLAAYRSALAVSELEAGPEGEKPETRYGRYLAVRLAGIGPTDAKRFRQASEKDSHVWTEGDAGEPYQAFDGYATNGDTPGVDLFLPARYRGTLVEYLMKVHEMEHVIQEATHGSILTGPRPGPQDYRDLFAMARVKYFIEKTAMAAEWRFLHAIPAAERERLIETLRADKELEADARDQMIRTLADSSLGIEAYVRRQHEAKRYAPASILDDLIAGVKERNAGPRRDKTDGVLSIEMRAAIVKDVEQDPLLSAEEKREFLALLPQPGKLF